MKRKRYTYIPKDEIAEVRTFNDVSFESDDLLDGAYVKGRKKFARGGMPSKRPMSYEEQAAEAVGYDIWYSMDSVDQKDLIQELILSGMIDVKMAQDAWSNEIYRTYDGGMFNYELKVQHDYPYKNIANRWLEDNSKDSLKYKLAVLLIRGKKDPDEILGIEKMSQYAALLRSLEKAKGESEHEMSFRTENYSISEAEKWARESLSDIFYVHGEMMADGGMMEDGGYVAVSEKDGYLFIISKPTTKQKAQQQIDLGGMPKGEKAKVISVEDAKAHKKVIGREYLADGGMMAYADGGMVLSNDEIIKDIDFEDNTDRRLGRYDFSFSTYDKEGAEILDYDGYIIESSASSRMNDEIEWGQNIPEDWETAEKILLDAFANWKYKSYADGGVTGSTYMVKYSMKETPEIVKEKMFSDKDSAELFYETISEDEDLVVMDLQEVKVAPAPKKSLFATAKPAPATAASKKKRERVEVDGIADEIARYDELKATINNAKAEQEVIGGMLKEIGREKFLDLYEQRGVRPANFDLADGSENILLEILDKYLKVEPEKAELLRQFDGLLEEKTSYEFDSELLEKEVSEGMTIGDVVSMLIQDSKLIPDGDKANLIKAKMTMRVPKGTIDRLMDYDNPREVFSLISPILALK